MRVIELAKLSGTAPHVIRYYERIGLLSAGRDPHNGYRRFERSDVVRVRVIRRFAALGLTLKDIGNVLSDLDEGSPVGNRVEALMRAHEASLREQRSTLERAHERVCRALETWRTREYHRSSALRQPCELIAALSELDRYGACAGAQGCAADSLSGS